MRSPDAGRHERAPLRPLILMELRDLAAGRAFWVLLLLVTPLVGYSFAEGVALYAQASRAAAEFPALARGLSPFDGIVVPTFGALYLAATFLFPFVAIRTIGAEKQSGGQKLLLQLPYGIPSILGAKLAVLALAWVAMALVPLSALLIWLVMGGHLGYGETLNLLLGHFVYATVVAGIAILAATLAENSATAAILVLAATLGFWVLDFAAAGEGGLLKALSGLSLTAVLRGYERGVLSVGATLASLVAAGGLVAIAGAWLATGRKPGVKLALSIAFATVVAAGGSLVANVGLYFDASEDMRNSFRPAIAAALRSLDRPLTVIVRLAPEDSRLVDFEKDVLGKLRRTVPDINVVLESESRSGRFEAASEHYGEIVYRYAGHEEVSRSTNAVEILPLILGMADARLPAPVQAPAYPGYPLVGDAHAAGIWFYVVLPFVIVIAWAFSVSWHRRAAEYWRRRCPI